MDTLVTAFGPVFAAGFAIQQLLEMLDGIFEKASNKKVILGIVSLIAGFVLAFGAGLSVLDPLGWTGAAFWDSVVTGLVISAGTEGINSIMKFLGYKKDNENPENKDDE